jgi:formiminotetrahydrofolate cyclodeaminase
VSDAGCAALAATAALKGAHLNVRINLPSCPEGDEKERIGSRAAELAAEGGELATDTARVVDEKLAQEEQC